MLTQARVDFKKPDIRNLRKQGFTLADMHVHTLYSDGINRVKTILKKAKKLGVGISITDHNDIRGSLKAAGSKDVMVIPGIETTTNEGIHTLFYFYGFRDMEEFYKKHILKNKKKITPYLDININDILEYSKDFNCIVSAAHPFAPSITGLCKPFHKKYVNKKTINNVNAVEVISGFNLRKRNLKALDFAHKNKKNITGGTDAHSLHEIGGTLTYTKERKTVSDFLESILKNKNFVIGKETMLINKAVSHTGTIRLAKNPIPFLKRNVEYTSYRIKNIKNSDSANKLKKALKHL